MSDQREFDQIMVDKLMDEFQMVRRRLEYLVENEKECLKIMKQIKFDIHALNQKYAKINKVKSPL